MTPTAVSYLVIEAYQSLLAERVEYERIPPMLLYDSFYLICSSGECRKSEQSKRYTSPSPYREYSSYPGKGKVLLS